MGHLIVVLLVVVIIMRPMPLVSLRKPHVYLVPELRYPCHCCCLPCHCPPPRRRPPHHRHHHHHGGIPEGGPRENPRSLSSPKAEKFEFDFFWIYWTEGGTDGVTYTIRWSRIKIA